MLNASHCLMGKKLYTFGDRQASIIKFVLLLIRSVNSKVYLRSSPQKDGMPQLTNISLASYVYTTNDATHCYR